VIGDILQPTHLLFVLVIALLVLGPKRLPEVGRSLGRGLRDFRNAVSGDDSDRHEEVPMQTAAATTTPVPEPVTTTPTPVQPPAESATAEHSADSATTEHATHNATPADPPADATPAPEEPQRVG
jgi:sec-independent protein translocase protein TatA